MKWVKGSISPSSHRLKVHSSQMASSASILSLMKTQPECCQRSKWDKTELELKTMSKSSITVYRCSKLKKREHLNILKTPAAESRTCWRLKRLQWLKKSRSVRWGQQRRSPNLSQLEMISTALPFLFMTLSPVLLIGINNFYLQKKLTIQCLMNLQCQSRWT